MNSLGVECLLKSSISPFSQCLTTMDGAYNFYCSHRLSMLPMVKMGSSGGELQGGGLTERQQPITCASCRSIKFIDLPRDSLVVPSEETKHYANGVTLMVVRRGLPYKPGCDLCSVLSTVHLNARNSWVPDAFNMVRVPKNHPWEKLLRPTQEGDYRMGPTILQGSPSIFRGQRVPERYDYRRAKIWVENCLHYHKRCRTGKQIPSQMRLMDCYEKKIVKADPSSRWVALSYVWGPNDVSASTNQKKNVERYSWPSCIPRTVADAMTVTVDLGFRYLWCDAYCIEQNNNIHKADQIRNMDKIYRYAEFTIVATGSSKHSGLPGVNCDRQSQYKVFSIDNRNIACLSSRDAFTRLQSSVWMERGWTFQESLMSKRLLVFTDFEMSFYCDTASWTESIGGVEHIKDPNGVTWDDWSTKLSPVGSVHCTSTAPYPESIFHQHQNFMRLVAQYTTRKLSHDSDTLNAFFGAIEYAISLHEAFARHALTSYTYIQVLVRNTALALPYRWPAILTRNNGRCRPQRRVLFSFIGVATAPS
jgi:hypothetical protein